MKRSIALFIAVLLALTSITTAFAEDVEVESIKISLKSTTMKIGDTQKVIITVNPSDAELSYEYKSDNSGVVTAAVGTLIAKAEGTANITVSVKGTDIKDTVLVTVLSKDAEDNFSKTENNDNTSDEQIKVSKITLENKTIYLERYETEKLVYSVYPENAVNKEVLFRSSNTSIATVDDRGYIYAKRTGNTTITVETEDGKTKATAKVYVSGEDDNTDSSLRSIYIIYEDELVKDRIEVVKKTTKRLSVKVSPASASKSVKWKSSNERIATVDNNGQVTGIKKGTCTIYAISTSSASKRDSVIVEVTDYIRYPDKITIVPQENAVYETGKTVQLSATVYPEDTTERKLIWTVSGGAVVTQNGLVTITDSGEVVVKAYSSNHKVVGEFTFSAKYDEGHFEAVGETYNLRNNKGIELYFSSEVNAYSATRNIFVTTDETGNENKVDILVSVNGKRIEVSPVTSWPEGNVYIFIKENICDASGNSLRKNIKYKMNIRGNMYDK